MARPFRINVGTELYGIRQRVKHSGEAEGQTFSSDKPQRAGQTF